MKKWIVFDNRFCQTPPEWAKNDPKWVNKLKSIADTLAQMDKALTAENFLKVHRTISKMYQELLHLFDTLPMSPYKKILIRISGVISSLMDAVELHEKKAFVERVALLSSEIALLKAAVAANQVNSVTNLELKVDSLKAALNANGPQIPFPAVILAGQVETDFEELNRIFHHERVQHDE